MAARRTTYRGLPEVVTLNHSDICNLRCIMCQRSLGQGKHRLDERVLEHVTRELFPTARKAVLTTAGGDPLAVDFEFMLERALRFDVRLDVVTNGLLLSRETYRHARPVLDHLNVSLDSHVPAVYERIRAGSSFDRVWRNLEHLAQERRAAPDDVLFSISAVVMKSNLPHLADFIRAVQPLRPDGIVLQQLRHEEKPTLDEEPSGTFSADEIRHYLDAAVRTAQAVGANLFLSEFRRPNVLSSPPRAKIPMTLEGHGLCWFLAQNFNVMYTGEVFPCCIPTDFCLGDVRYEDPVEIWNGEPFRRLRSEHLTGRGNLFCSGCMHAPHLAADPDEERVAAERLRRAKSFEAESERRRAIEDLHRRPIYAADLPLVGRCDGGFIDSRPCVHVATEWVGVDTAVRTQAGVLAIRAGLLEERCANAAPGQRVDLTAFAGGKQGTCMHALADGATLIGFEQGGALLRVDGTSIHRVLELSDIRSFVRTAGVATARDGSIWVGEYGVFPGARCAWLYRSTDGGRTFAAVTRFAEARHVHRVLALADGAIAVTTGDLAAERRLYRGDGSSDFTCVSPGWSGFFAALERDGACHFGTELMHRNGLLIYPRGLDATPEYRPFPDALDLQVRSITALDDGTLLALLGMDLDLVEQRAGRRPTLLASDDGGHRWSVVHRFAEDWSDEPEDLIPLTGGRVWAIGPDTNHTLDLAVRGGLSF